MAGVKTAKPSYLGLLLSVVALLGQWLLPMAHAQAWATRNGDPLLYAFCGDISPALLEKIQASTLPELLKQRQGDHEKLAKLSCNLCVGMHAGHLAGGGLPAFAFAAISAAPPHSEARRLPPSVQQLWLPPLRGPPRPA
jgi:hypothetical protein